MSATKQAITFSFGKNWRSYVDTITENSIRRAMDDIEAWLEREAIAGKTVLDIGCGSGIHSLCFYELGAKAILSLDVDPYSVEATRVLWEKAGRPEHWKVLQGSILNPDFVSTLGQHEIVYSWGVLHHTGAMWDAIGNAASLVKPGGKFWIAIYVKGPLYPEHLRLKQSYNNASGVGKRIIVLKEVYQIMRRRWSAGENPLTWNEKRERGMDTYHDLLDWLGGLPYEVATTDEIVTFCTERGFVLERIKELGEGANNIYLFSRSDQQPNPREP
jgi:SAM-dependent methyltransferase